MPTEAGTIRLESGAVQHLDTRPDVDDRRDYYYTPTLSALRPSVDARRSDWWASGRIRDQGGEPSCTGHALASIVDHLYARDILLGENGRVMSKQPQFSASMLYNVGRYHDDWLGEGYPGSSIRGVLKGFYYNGVCTRKVLREHMKRNADPRRDSLGWHMTREILNSARLVQLGAYYRVRHRLPDLHAALNEADLVIASADIHDGWKRGGHRIGFEAGATAKRGRHAFVVIGYDDHGLLVQNSWGGGWGQDGVAVWSYQDWAENILDMWVIRLSAPLENRAGHRLPQLATNRHLDGQGASEAFGLSTRDLAPKRLDVLGHLVPLSRGQVDGQGTYHVDERTLEETARIVRQGLNDDGDFRYRHLLLHFVGIQASEEDAVAAICKTLPVYKANGIYPEYIMVENALSEAIHSECAKVIDEANRISGTRLSPEKDERIEGKLSLVCLRLVEQIESSAAATFRVISSERGRCEVREGKGTEMLNEIFKAQEDRHRDGTLSYHFSAHGFGARVLDACLAQSHRFETRPVISSVSLFAPMLRQRDFENHLLPLLVDRHDGRVNRRSQRDAMTIESVQLRVFAEAAHRADRPFHGYGCSWPELWAHCFAIAAPPPPTSTEVDLIYRSASPYDQRRTAVRFMALPEVARDAVASARDYPVSLAMLSPDERGLGDGESSLPSPRHSDLDMRIRMLDLQLETILGHGGNPTFASYYPGRDSLMTH